MKKIFFNIRPSSRERMWDTIKYSSEFYNVVLPDVQQQSSIRTYSKNISSSFISKLKTEVSKRIINKQKIDKNKTSNIDILYLWGAFPKNNTSPFILELDNPYSLAYYHFKNFQNNKTKIKRLLDKAYKITYLSETCKNHTLELYGEKYRNKSFVNYPYMDNNYKKNKRDNNIINFIFVGLNSRGKGGAEVLEAFHHINYKNIKLTFISNVTEDILLKYKNDTRISILPPQPREKLLNEIYPKMDVMIFPSLYESFGVVLLEALSYGMGIITMNTYATPEIVKNNFNGKLIHHPIIKPTILNNKKVINCVDLRVEDFYNRYLVHNEFYFGLYLELKEAIDESILKYKFWQENSLKLFNEKFSPKIWQKNFKNIIE